MNGDHKLEILHILRHGVYLNVLVANDYLGRRSEWLM